MSQPCGVRAALLFGLVLALPSAGGAGGDKKKEDPQKQDLRTGIAECVSPTGTLVACYGPGAGCVVVKGRGVLFPEDRVLALPGYRAELETAKGAVRLALLGNAQPSATPVQESAVRLHRGDKADLDFTLERGRVVVRPDKAKKPVRVRVRLTVPKEVLELELDPGAEVALETFSRWLAGTPFQAKPKADHEPMTEVLFLLTKGRARATLNDGQGEQ